MPQKPFNPKNSAQMTRLRNAMKESKDCLATFKGRRVDTIKQYAGKHYSDNAASEKVPVNLIEMATNIYVRHLAARTPQTMVDADKEYKRQALIFELALNQLLKEICLGNTLERAVTEAIFCMGIVKVGMTTVEDGYEEEFGRIYDAGQPYADVIHFDHWVHDVRATRPDNFDFCGNRYRLSLDYVKSSDLYIKKNTAKLKPTEYESHDEDGEEKAESLGKGDFTTTDGFRDQVELWDIWLPHDKLIVTVDDEDGNNPLRIVEWEGPENGPYHYLRYGEVPDNVMPLAPAHLWVDLHDLTNRLYLKLGRQAERQKTILGVQGSGNNAKDGERIVSTRDGEAIYMDNPNSAREYRFGGVDQTNFAFTMAVKELFNEMGGNLSVLGGLAPQSDTASQDKLLSNAATKRLSHMQSKTVEFTSGIIKDLGWWLWHDPLIELPLTHRTEHYSLNVTFSADEKEGEFYDYNIEVNPYSSQDFSPSEKTQTMMQIWERIVMPAMDQIMQSGKQLDVVKFIERVAKLTNVGDEFADLIVDSGLSPEEIAVKAAKHGVGSNPQGGGETIRRNVAQSTPRGHEQVMQQLLLGGNPQDSQRASLARPVG